MGSSAMGASVLRKKIQEAGYGDVTVVNRAISNLDDTWDLVVTHQDLAGRAFPPTPSAVHVTVDNFMASPKYDEIVELVAATNGTGCRRRSPEAAEEDRGGADGLLPDEAIVLGGTAGPATRRSPRPVSCWSPPARSTPRTSRRCTSARGRSPRTWATGWPSRTAPTRPSVDPAHGAVLHPLPRGDRLERQQAKFVVGIAGAGDDHLALLGKIAQVFADADKVAAARGGPDSRGRPAHPRAGPPHADPAHHVPGQRVSQRA